MGPEDRLHFPGSVATRPRPLRRRGPAPSARAAGLGARLTSQRPRAARACPVWAQRPRPWERQGGSGWPGAERCGGTWRSRAGQRWTRGRAGAGAAGAKLPGRCSSAEPGPGAAQPARAAGAPVAGAARACEGSRARARGWEVRAGAARGDAWREGAAAAGQGRGAGRSPQSRASLCPGAARLSLAPRLMGGERAPRFVHGCGCGGRTASSRVCQGTGGKRVRRDLWALSIRGARWDVRMLTFSETGVGCDSLLLSGLAFLGLVT